MIEVCAVYGCEAEATMVADVPAYPMNWVHPVCENHFKALENPFTKLDYLGDDTVAVVEGETEPLHVD